jgi:hypothetical protein
MTMLLHGRMVRAAMSTTRRATTVHTACAARIAVKTDHSER